MLVTTETVVTDDNRDDCVDDIISRCLNLNEPKSFFLFAGAGSGKTKSLVQALDFINVNIGKSLLQSGRKVAVITYTNAASEEIKQRSMYNSLFEISTIHSFAWSLISGYTNDIRAWLKAEIQETVAELNEKQRNSRNTNTKAYKNRAEKITKCLSKSRYLDSIKRFTYNPDGVNLEPNSLDHSEVIKITRDFLLSKPTFRAILVDKYPIVLIDESQDTNKGLMSAFSNLQNEYKDRFILGLFGDTMQRIYLEGKEDLAESIPPDWEKPVKAMNHRSQKRIVDLCNSIRKGVDNIQQQSRLDKPNGLVRVFITDLDNPIAIEKTVCEKMCIVTSDEGWCDVTKVKGLTIEHNMAASRLGFKTFYESLNKVDSYKQGLVKGNLSVIGFFTHILIPLDDARVSGNQFAIMRIAREYSTFFSDKEKSLTLETLELLNSSINELLLALANNQTTCRDLLNIVYANKVFPIHKDLLRLIEDFPQRGEEDFEKFENLRLALDVEFVEAKKYYTYVKGEANFDTHQGVKGLEFDRVMIIIDDSSARGNTFNYNRLFGIEDKTSTDIKNEQEGKETSLDRTRRLFYVTCSRAKESLAIVYYASSVDCAYNAILATGWFDENEIEIITS